MYSDLTSIADTDILGCEWCDSGHICDGGEVQADPEQCPSGYWCNVNSERPERLAMFPCPAGMKTKGVTGATTMAAACELCTAGNYCQGSDKAETTCLAGFYCPAGTESSHQYPCPAGTFNANTGSTSDAACSPCTAGKFCP